MKNKIYEIFKQIASKRDYWLNAMKNAKIYHYHEKYTYHVVYFDIYEMDLIKLKIKFIPRKGFFTCELFMEYKRSFAKSSIPTESNLVEEFDQAMLFMHNRQLKRQILIDFI